MKKRHIDKGKSKSTNKKKDFVKDKKTDSLGLIFKFVLVVVFLSIGFNIYNQGKEIEMLKNQLSEVEQVYQDKSKSLKAIKKDINSVDTPYYIEKKARQDLKMVKSDEIVYVDKNRDENIRAQ